MRIVRFFIVFILITVCTAVYAQEAKIRTQHKVEKSETVFGIAKKYGITIQDLIEANPQMNKAGYELKYGDTLNIPFPKGPQDKNASNNTTTTPVTTTTQQPVQTDMTGPKNIKVGVMLPLHDNDGDGRRMVEYYRGLLLGCDRVNKDGISVDMHAWNVPNGADITEVLKEKDAANLDIIIGPLYSTQVKPLAEFCQQNNTMMVIPFSITGNDVENYPNIYQVYQPQEDFDAMTIRNFIQWFNKYHVVIVDCEDETSTKGTFTKQLRDELDKLNIKYSLTSLKTPDNDFAKAFSLSEQNVVVVNTEKSPALNSTLAKLNILTENNTNIGVSLFGYKEWLIYTSVYQDYYFKYDAYIPSYFYYNGVSPDTKWVERNYNNRFNATMNPDNLPRFALTGFDHACFFIGGLSQFGKNFTGAKGQATYKPVQSPLKFRQAGKGHKNITFMFVHYKNDRTVESISY